MPPSPPTPSPTDRRTVTSAPLRPGAAPVNQRLRRGKRDAQFDPELVRDLIDLMDARVPLEVLVHQPHRLLLGDVADLHDLRLLDGLDPFQHGRSDERAPGG